MQYSYNVRTGAITNGWGTAIRSNTAGTAVSIFRYMRSMVDSFKGGGGGSFRSIEERKKKEGRDMVFHVTNMYESKLIPPSTPRKTFDLKWLPLHENIALLLDVLVRLKYLDLMIAKESNNTTATSSTLATKTQSKPGVVLDHSQALTDAKQKALDILLAEDRVVGGGGAPKTPAILRAELIEFVMNNPSLFGFGEGVTLNLETLLDHCEVLMLIMGQVTSMKEAGITTSQESSIYKSKLFKAQT
jgi:hypothetical protein